MRNLNIVRTEKPSDQWTAWIRGLTESGFIVRELERSVVDSHEFSEVYTDAILLDGMLPQLPRLISSICARHPDTQIVVATESDSFTIYYEVLHLNGAIYVSGPLPSDQFAATIQAVFSQQFVA